MTDPQALGSSGAGSGTARSDGAGLGEAGSGEAGEAFRELVEVMDRLRSPGGCPWDAEQTHATLAPYAIEEAYEVAEAAERGDRAHLREELGDLLLQVVFHARLATEDRETPFDAADVIRDLVAKLRRRHPHVFGDASVTGAAEVDAAWERIKSEERRRAAGTTEGAADDGAADDGAAPDGAADDGVPLALPALARAQKIVARARRDGRAGPSAVGTDLGSRLLALVAEAQEQGLDAEAALRAATRQYEARPPAPGRAAGTPGTPTSRLPV